jgi:alkylated DNA repair dioxygenase AlkB
MIDATPDLFPDASATLMPAGFEYRADLIDRAEEAVLVAAIEDLELAPYEFRGVKARRKVVSFGFQHGYQSRGLRAAADVPAFLNDLRIKAAAFAGLPADAFEQALISEYSLGTPIGWHVDRPQYDKIVGVSLLSPATLRLRRRVEDHWQRASMVLQARSAYLLAGEARASWQHSIPAVPALRYSVTFRTLKQDLC